MDFEELARQRSKNTPFTALLGITVTKIELGYAKAEMVARPEFMNSVNTLHGGCSYSLADVVVGSAAMSYGTKTVTVSGSYQYLSSVKLSEKITAVARCTKNGRSLLYFDVEVFSESGALVGKGVFTAYRLDRPALDPA